MNQSEGELLWRPSVERSSRTNIADYIAFLRGSGYGDFASYDVLWEWSVRELEAFWESIWTYFSVTATTPYESVLNARRMPGARWFAGAHLNFAEHLLRHAARDGTAIIHIAENGTTSRLQWAELRSQAAAVAQSLRRAGVGVGDRVVSTLPNIPEAVVAFIATASVGAIWSGAAPELGRTALRDRFAQIEPSFLFACDGYLFGGRTYDRSDVVRGLQENLPTLRGCVLHSTIEREPDAKSLAGVRWHDVIDEASAPLTFEPVEANHPLWIVYTSGTTGPPKPIVHTHAGILLERLKASGLHLDLRAGDVFFWYTTTSWIMWNIAVSTLANGATIVLYDGNPQLRGSRTLWDVAERAQATLFGASASFLEGCMREGLSPRKTHDLRLLRTVGSTAAPLSTDAFRWVYENVRSDIMLANSSGGTDVATAFVGSCPILPVYAGRIQCRCLGVDVRAVDDAGNPIKGEVGELAIASPMPSMPVFFWGDLDNAQYTKTYFDRWPQLWSQGDAIRIFDDGSAAIIGRSDATLNRRGVRIGTSEIYRVVEALDGIADSLVAEVPGDVEGDTRMELFVVPDKHLALDETFKDRIHEVIRRELSPRHVPDQITPVRAIPRSLNGKKLEVPVKRILSGAAIEDVVDPAAVANVGDLQEFRELFDKRSGALN
jgi:acetoacetyl-CoA synthetase